MSYIASYGGYVFKDLEDIPLERMNVLADMAKSGIVPGKGYSDYECAVWVIMSNLISYGEDKRNYYRKTPKPNSQDLHVL